MHELSFMLKCVTKTGPEKDCLFVVTKIEELFKNCCAVEIRRNLAIKKSMAYVHRVPIAFFFRRKQCEFI